MRILVLDDNEPLRIALSDILTSFSHEVDTTEDARAAIKLVETTDYDFILVDYKMPVNDGIWFMKNVKLNRRTKVLLMTAFVDNDVISEMFKLGAVGYMIKPFDAKELIRHIDFHSGQQPSASPPGV
ncbi:MAG: response regulator [bacterium]